MSIAHRLFRAAAPLRFLVCFAALGSWAWAQGVPPPPPPGRPFGRPGGLLSRLPLQLQPGPQPGAAGPVIEAAAGEPFGVGRIELQATPDTLPLPLGADGISVSGEGGRVLYPTIDSPQLIQMAKGLLTQSGRPAAQALGQLIGQIMPGQRVTVYFLFRGAGPLQLTLETRGVQAFQVQPANDPAAYQRLLTAWWKAYNQGRGLFFHNAEYPPLVENYLQAMLARRLQLPPPEGKKLLSGDDPLADELGLLLDTEAVRASLVRARVLGGGPAAEPANLPVPQPAAVPELIVPDVPADVPVEALSTRVPAECLYVRFGSFTNFLWFQDLLARWGGDLRNLVDLRGLDYGMSQRMQQQLVLKQGVLSRLFGEAAVADAAIVGLDSFLAEGGAIGILFQARTGLLANDIASQRQEALKNVPGASEQKITLAGREASFLSTPDGAVHSYYVSDGDFHLVTTSAALARLFLEVAQAKGAGSLAQSSDFRAARVNMPLAHNDTIFVYLSDAFFRNQTTPLYRLEMERRLRAVADIEAVQMARLTAATEGQPAGTIAELIAGGFLPSDFGPRADGSQTVMQNGVVYDSLRGHRGLFVPIPDVPVQAVTAAEADRYTHFAQTFQEQIGRVEPLMAGLRREVLDGGKREHMTVDAQLSPLDRKHYDYFMDRLGPPDKNRVAPVPGDALEFDAVLTRQRLFGGLRDVVPPPEAMQGAIITSDGVPPLGRLRDLLIGYLGFAGEKPGLLGFFDRRMPPPDAGGLSHSALDLWRQQAGPLTVYSFQPDVLAAVVPQLRMEEAPRAAQIRLRRRPVARPGGPAGHSPGLRAEPADGNGQSAAAARHAAAVPRAGRRCPSRRRAAD